MDALEMAKQALGEFEKAASKEKRPPTIEVFAQRAFVSAAVAQAEQLKRIADCLNAMASTTAGIEDALYGKRGLIAPDAQDFDNEKDYHYALLLYLYRKNAPAGMSLEEWTVRNERTDYADPQG